MPRCNCSDTRCSCVIVDSATVTWTGAGRPDNPFRAEAAAGGAGGGGGGWDPGDIKWTARATAPPGWLVADGSPVSRSVYPDLWAAIGPLYGAGDGATTFNLPDWTGRFVLGADPDHPLGSAGGATTATLAAANLPAHAHPIDHNHTAFDSNEAGLHHHNLSSSDGIGGSANRVPWGKAGPPDMISDAPMADDGAHTHRINPPGYTGTSGLNPAGGAPLNVLNPYTTGLPLIKT